MTDSFNFKTLRRVLIGPSIHANPQNWGVFGVMGPINMLQHRAG